MKLLLLLIIIISVMIFVPHGALLSQKNIADPLMPEDQSYSHREIGLVFGIGQNKQYGDYLTTNCNCLFSGGMGTGVLLGLLYEGWFTRSLHYGGILYYNNLSVKNSYQELESVAIKSPSTGYQENRPVLFGQESEAGFKYIAVMPYIEWAPVKLLFLRFGVSASYLLEATLTQNKSLMQHSVRLSNGEVAEINIVDATDDKAVIEDGEFPEATKFIFSLDPMLGMSIPLGLNLFLNPVFHYSIPLQPVSVREEDFKIGSWRFLIEVHWAFKMNY